MRQRVQFGNVEVVGSFRFTSPPTWQQQYNKVNDGINPLSRPIHPSADPHTHLAAASSRGP